jgi:chromosome segregation ATPase
MDAVEGVTDPQLQDIAGSIARLETFQAELMSKDIALARMKTENETLIEASARSSINEHRVRAAETRLKEVEHERDALTKATTHKEVELLHVLSAHRDYEKKLLAEIAKLEQQTSDHRIDTDATLRSLQEKVHDGEIYAVRLEEDRHKISTELTTVIENAESVQQSHEATQIKVGRLEAQVDSLQQQLKESEQNESAFTSRLTEQQTTIDELTWQVRKLEREIIDGEQKKTKAIERAAQSEQTTAALNKRIVEYQGEFKTSSRLSETLGNQINELKEKLKVETSNADTARKQMNTSTEELYREKNARTEWAQARLQLLQEICDEESLLQAELDSWDNKSITYNGPSEQEMGTIFGGVRSRTGSPLSAEPGRNGGSSLLTPAFRR